MFWGLILLANKKYSQTVTKSFHVSCAALDQSTATSAKDVQVMLLSDDNAHLLCTLRKGAIYQVPLDLNFFEGDKISFATKGGGIVHLTGYQLPDQEDLDESDENEEREDDAMEMGASKKIKPETAGNKGAAAKKEEDSNDDDAEEVGSEKESEGGSTDEYQELEDADSDDDDSDDVTAADSDEEVEELKAKVQKLDAKKDGKAKTNGVAYGKEQPNKCVKAEAPAAAKPTVVMIVQDLRVGTGLEAKNGKKVQVYYKGRFKTNNKVFNSTKRGPGFKFVLGRGDVIKGWDLGVAGMKVGGKRRITCPPAVAYGAKGSPPLIPPNSTLVFDVVLKNVS